MSQAQNIPEGWRLPKLGEWWKLFNRQSGSVETRMGRIKSINDWAIGCEGTNEVGTNIKAGGFLEPFGELEGTSAWFMPPETLGGYLGVHPADGSIRALRQVDCNGNFHIEDYLSGWDKYSVRLIKDE